MRSNTRAPGWYINPEDSSQWRYWEGRRWTRNREPRDPRFPDVPPIKIPSFSRSLHVSSTKEQVSQQPSTPKHRVNQPPHQPPVPTHQPASHQHPPTPNHPNTKTIPVPNQPPLQPPVPTHQPNHPNTRTIPVPQPTTTPTSVTPAPTLKRIFDVLWKSRSPINRTRIVTIAILLLVFISRLGIQYPVSSLLIVAVVLLATKRSRTYIHNLYKKYTYSGNSKSGGGKGFV